MPSRDAAKHMTIRDLRARVTKLETTDVDALLARVHARIELGLQIQTFAVPSEIAVEVRWRRDYGEDGWSDERFASGPTIVAILQKVLDHEDEADRLDALELRAE